ncbi:MAG TPA: hypothetical protein VLE96_05870 [Chlamydiales bacterium]|nr:hypothetical protein [Chlamydiales bacterium]
MTVITNALNTINPKNWMPADSSNKSTSLTNLALRTATGVAGANLLCNGINSAREMKMPSKDNWQATQIAKTLAQLIFGGGALVASVK